MKNEGNKKQEKKKKGRSKSNFRKICKRIQRGSLLRLNINALKFRTLLAEGKSKKTKKQESKNNKKKKKRKRKKKKAKDEAKTTKEKIEEKKRKTT